MDKNIGVLLINIGTPDSPTEGDLAVYLEEFLGDPYVVDYPRWFWNIVLRQIILRVRPAKSAKLYAKIWTDKGSPLLYLTQSIAEKIHTTAPNLIATAGMRYGNPSLESAIETLREKGVRDLIIFPLFPQYSSSTSLTAIEAAKRVAAKKEFDSIRVISDYHQNAKYIGALAANIRETWEKAGGKTEKMLFSFHGIPRRYITKKGEPYQQQCLTTADLVAMALGLGADEYLVSFQSRFGPEEWLMPYTDKTLEMLGIQGCESVSVICPGFAVDCLETLEEIAVEGKEIYETAGGKNFLYVPALNDGEAHIQALLEIINEVVADK
jgi:ferrochelatase